MENTTESRESIASLLVLLSVFISIGCLQVQFLAAKLGYVGTTLNSFAGWGIIGGFVFAGLVVAVELILRIKGKLNAEH